MLLPGFGYLDRLKRRYRISAAGDIIERAVRQVGIIARWRRRFRETRTLDARRVGRQVGGGKTAPGRAGVKVNFLLISESSLVKLLTC